MTDLLIVEDNRAIAAGLSTSLESEGYSVAVASDGPAGLAAMSRERPALVILDLMLPGMDGYSLLERWRADGYHQPVLVLSALGEQPDKVRGFRLGADDYVTKPFGLDELLARVAALLRRHRVWQQPLLPLTAPVHFGSVEIRPSSRTVLRDGTLIALRPREYDLLWAMVSQPEVLLSRRALLSTVWGYSPDVASRTVDIHMVELRRKLEADPANPRHLLTVRKAGYLFRR
jgi:two-component system response regulator MtrA